MVQFLTIRRNVFYTKTVMYYFLIFIFIWKYFFHLFCVFWFPVGNVGSFILELAQIRDSSNAMSRKTLESQLNGRLNLQKRNMPRMAAPNEYRRAYFVCTRCPHGCMAFTLCWLAASDIRSARQEFRLEAMDIFHRRVRSENALLRSTFPKNPLRINIQA